MALESRRSRAARSLTVPAANLTADDELILHGTISEQRRQAFLDRFLKDRAETRTIEMLFDRVGALTSTDEAPPSDVVATGFRGLLHKGPFVDGSNWLQGSTWSFATELERHLAQRLDALLREVAPDLPSDPLASDPLAIVDGMELLHQELEGRGYRTTLLVVAGDLDWDVRRQLDAAPQGRFVPEWDRRVQETLRTTYRMLGMWRDVPVLELPESHENRLIAADLARFATLTRYSQPTDFALVEFSESEARALLVRQPRLIMDPPPESGAEQDRIRRLRLRVGLDLWEAYGLTPRDTGAVVSRRIGSG